ncbi:MAG: putative bifunctional diguanylate cyclase/phosphodiesterase [Neptuniibacter sp.]
MMRQDTFPKNVSSWKTFWLIPIVLIFFISALVSLIQLKQSISILDARHGTSVWTLFQLRSEMRRFIDTLTIYEKDPSTLENVHHRYDILWSRFPVALKGVDSQQLSKIDGALDQIKTAFSEVKSLESLVFEGLPTNQKLALDIKAKIYPHLETIEKLSHDNFHSNNAFYNRSDREVAEMQEQLIWLMFGLISTGSLLLLMVLRENKVNLHQAEHDSLTNMPNRAFLRKVLSDRCASGLPFALHLIDLNGFKHINDSFGHHAGDQILQAVSSRLRDHIDRHYKCITCRLGGDEFAIVQTNVDNEHQIKQLACAIIDVLGKDLDVGNHLCQIGASIGSTMYPHHGRDGSTLLSHADIAMYQAKDNAPESSQKLFSFKMLEKINRRSQLQRELRGAIEKGELHLEYQPIISFKDGRVASLEALLRWNHPILNAVPPLEIIDVAEKYGVTEQLGLWLIQETARQIKAWSDEGLPRLPVSINISPSMYQQDLVAMINTALEENQLPKGLIWIEITEDTSIQIIHKVQKLLPSLSAQGIRASLDDFGTGLSSLSHLQQLPIQTLKIDRSFISHLQQNETSRALVKHIIDIGHDLGLNVVAEGIEEAYSDELLKQYQCDYAQGYYYSRPMRPELICDFFNSYPP